MIRSLGPEAVFAVCEYDRKDRAESAGNWVLANDRDFLALARSRRAVIAAVEMSGGSMLIFGGLLRPEHLSGLHEQLYGAVRPTRSQLYIPSKSDLSLVCASRQGGCL